MMRFAQIDVEIEPFSLRGQFEFSIMLDILEIGADEYLGHVPIPEFIGFRGDAGIRMQKQLFIRAAEQKIKILGGPARTNLGAIARQDLIILIAVSVYRNCLAPKRGSGMSVEGYILLCLGSCSDSIVRGEHAG